MGSLPPVIGPYRVIRQLGEGGMGVVYEAVHEVIQRRVAIKVLHPEAGRSTDTINRFINEARAANLVNHPGLASKLKAKLTRKPTQKSASPRTPQQTRPTSR